MTTSIAGGYKSLSVIQLCNVLAAVEQKRISYKAFRIFFAAVSMLATRQAVQRIKDSTTPVEFSLDEIESLIDTTSKRSIKGELTQLRAANLLQFSASEVKVNVELVEGAEERIDQITGEGRSGRRLVPVPRRVLRYLARCSKPAVAKAIIAYLIRGLSRKRDGGIHACGSVKSGWVAKIAGISLRAAKAARRNLIDLGWLSEDIGSFQRKLNRTGAYFEIDINWQLGEIGAQSKDRKAIQSVEECSNSALPTSPKCAAFAPPNKDEKTLSDHKNQKTHSGSSKKRLGEPQLNNIQPHDIKSMPRLLALCHQATAQGWLEASEANMLFFIAAAVHVKQTACKDPVRVFVSIIRNNLRSHITQAQEDHARRKFHAYQQKSRSHMGLSLSISINNKTLDKGIHAMKGLVPQVLLSVFGNSSDLASSQQNALATCDE
ncbi:MAG: hypothetical protein AAF821_00075 [Cyanobacteria bacterium P01_D01_bin.156]